MPGGCIACGIAFLLLTNSEDALSKDCGHAQFKLKGLDLRPVQDNATADRLKIFAIIGRILGTSPPWLYSRQQKTLVAFEHFHQTAWGMNSTWNPSPPLAVALHSALSAAGLADDAIRSEGVHGIDLVEVRPDQSDLPDIGQPQDLE
jgi:hypothetical protein